MTNSSEHKIRAAEDRLRDAMLTSDVHALDQLLSADLIFTNHSGQVLSKTDDIEAHEKGYLKISSLELSEQLIKPFGETFVVSVRAKLTGTYQGAPANGEFRFTRVWMKENNVWRVIAGHSSIIV